MGKTKQKDTVKQSKSDIELHKKEQKVEKPIETTQQKDVSPTIEKTSPMKEHEQATQPKEEKQDNIIKDASVDERDTTNKDSKKDDSIDIPELETVQVPQDKTEAVAQAPIASE